MSPSYCWISGLLAVCRFFGCACLQTNDRRQIAIIEITIKLANIQLPSPWSNRIGWLGVKHQITYCSTSCLPKVHSFWKLLSLITIIFRSVRQVYSRKESHNKNLTTPGVTNKRQPVQSLSENRCLPSCHLSIHHLHTDDRQACNTEAALGRYGKKRRSWLFLPVVSVSRRALGCFWAGSVKLWRAV